MKENGLPLQLYNIIRSRDGINFLTAHGAKGMEFDYVFLIGCTKKTWQGKGARWKEYALPSTVRDPSKESDIEDERRLFYVAVTRARKHLRVSFSEEKLTGLVEEHAQFVGEIMDEDKVEPKEQKVSEEETSDFYLNLLQPAGKSIPLIDHGLIARHLERFSLSTTSLNDYLKCPRKFYFEHILRVPRANSPYTGFGIAVHRSLQLFLEELQKQKDIASDKVLTFFDLQMPQYRSHFTEEGYKKYLKHGEKILPGYVDANLDRWKKCFALFPEVPLNSIFRNVPLRGKIDLIERDEKGNAFVIDFKTGNVNEDWRYQSKIKPPKNSDDIGGDYWRQIVFYKILIESGDKHDFTVLNGRMSFVEPNSIGNYRDKDFILTNEDFEIVGRQIEESYKRIQNHEFDKSCGSSDCIWCEFVQNDFVLPDNPEEFEKKDDDREERDISNGNFTPEQLELEF
jgi:DNA helicase-2/ATP-dependent DNA helicase PcrA